MIFSTKAISTVSIAALLTAAGCQPQADRGLALVSSEPLDVERMLALLPDGLAGTYDAVEFDEATGANTLTNLRITSTDNLDVGVNVAEMVIWGFRPGMLEDRLEGSNLAESGRLLEQLEARDISLFGIETLYEDVNEAYFGVIEDVTTDLAGDGFSDEVGEAFEDAFVAIDKFDMRADRLTMRAVDLRPFERSYRPETPSEVDDSSQTADEIDFESEDLSVLMRYLQDVAAFNRSIGAEEMALEGLSYDFAVTSAGDEVAMAIALPSMRVEDWEGGDVGRVASENMSFSFSLPGNFVDSDSESDLEKIEMIGSFGTYLIEGVQLDKAYRYLALGEMPPRTETDLMSLGTWVLEDMTYSMFGAEFYSIRKSVVDFSGFHWLIPTDVSLDVDDLSYDFGSLFQNIIALDSELSEDEDLEQFMTILPVLEEYGLAAPVIDIDGQWQWDAEGGPASMGFAYGLERYGSVALDLSGVLPDFASTAEAIESSDRDAIDALFSRESAFSGGSLVLEDLGGIDNALSLAIDVAKVLPKGDGLDISNMSPEGLKGLAIGGLSFASSQVVQVFPPAAEYIASLSQYISDGGTLSLSVTPERPLVAKELAKLPELIEDADTFVNLIGLSVVHEPAQDSVEE